MSQLNKIVIVGGGTSGWIAAVAISNQLKGKLCEIELVESQDISTIGVGEAVIPPFLTYLKILGINEKDFIQKTQASFKLGIKFTDWQKVGKSYFHPFGRVGHKMRGNDFNQCWLKMKAKGAADDFMAYSPSFQMAKEGKFCLFPKMADDSPAAGVGYALHFDAKLVASYLREQALRNGVKRHVGNVIEVVKNENGNIESLVLDSAKSINGDFFIDCTGFQALLIEKCLKTTLENWSEYLPVDRAVTVQTENTGEIPPYTESTARDSGWTWKIPLQHRTGNGYVYSSQFCDDESARTTLLANVEGALINEPKVIKFKVGVRREMWKNNCLSLGLASGFLEPLESTAIHMVTRGLQFFLKMLPDNNINQPIIDEYNRRMYLDHEEIRNFLILHYGLTERNDTDFWRYWQSYALPASLKTKVSLFQSRGYIQEGVDDLFKADSWYAIFLGMGIFPERYDPIIDLMSFDPIENYLQEWQNVLSNSVKKLPSHKAFIEKNCLAKKENIK